MGPAIRDHSLSTSRGHEPADVGHVDPEQEIDVWWGAHSSRALVPSLVFSILLASIVGLSAYIVWRVYDLPPLEVRYTAYAIIGFIGLLQLWRWGYCVLTRTYRVTTRRLYVEKSFRRVPFLVFDLADITDVRVEQTPIQRKLRVGRLRLAVGARTKPILLKGMYEPGDLAIGLRRLVQEARDRRPAGDAEKPARP